MKANRSERSISLNIIGNSVNFNWYRCKTLQIRPVQLTTNNTSDSQVLGEPDERIDFVYTDGAYDTKYCRKVISNRQAHAVIPLIEMQSSGKIKD